MGYHARSGTLPDGEGGRLIASERIRRVGHLFYRYRQYLSMALLAVSIVVARPMTADPRLNLLVDLAAFGMVLAGGAIRSWAMGFHVWRRVHGAGSQRRLITAGPYSLVRNPLYSGTLLISGGVALMSGSWIIVAAYLVIFWLGYLAVIQWEEGKLTSEFGDAYRDYFAHVPRLIPAPRVWHRREGTFSWATMMRCMEPVKTAGFLVALAVMMWLKSGRLPA